MRVAVIGGGAAGFFYAINCKLHHPSAQVTIYEASQKVLQKVKVSGGGRCNVTHACFEPKELVKNYPRGHKELLGAFHRFQPIQTIGWFEERGVQLKTESDGRMFPVTDDSQTIIDCFLFQTKLLGVKLQTGMELNAIVREEKEWVLRFREAEKRCDVVMIASGSSKRVWKMIEALGHRIVPAVPSLFTLQIKDELLSGLEGLSCPNATVYVDNGSLECNGPLLITHWGLSGPAVLKLSAWGARLLHAVDYRFLLRVNFGSGEKTTITEFLQQYKTLHSKRKVAGHALFEIPLRLWQRLTLAAKISNEKNWADVSKQELLLLAEKICNSKFQVHGKSTFKEEFVTAGGVALEEVHFKTMESKLFPSLYFAGEVLDIDGVTGGFNFQSAWTTAWIAANHLSI